MAHTGGAGCGCGDWSGVGGFAGGAPVGGVFINFRSADSQMAAALIDRELTDWFGSDVVFLDSRSIPVGVDFEQELLGRLRACSVLLVVVGPRWLSVCNKAGGRRIDDPRDWIRREIVAAFAAGLRVVPVLVDGGRLPSREELPEDIAELAVRQYISVRRRYARADLRVLVGRIIEQDMGLAGAVVRRVDAGLVPRQWLVGLGVAVPGLSPAMLGLLRAQRIRAEDLPYRVLSGPQPALSSVYVEQRVVQHAEQRPEGEDVSAAPGRQRATGSVPKSGPVSVAPVVRSIPELLRADRHAVVIGEPGVGKSTLVQRLVGESARWWLSADADVGLGPSGASLPVRVSASALVGRPFEEALAAGLTADLGAYLDRSVTADLFLGPPMAGLRWLILVDGMDEILDVRERRSVIGALAERLSRPADGEGGYRFLVTSRPLPEQELAPLRIAGIGHWQLRPFDPHDLETFANNWFQARHPQTARQQAREFLDRIERSRLQAIVRTPLLAVVTAFVYEHGQQPALPIRQADLYEEFLRYLLQVRQETVRARLDLQQRFAPYTSDAALADWLFGHIRPLLEYLATEFLSGHVGPLSERAESWIARHRPELPHFVPDWADSAVTLLRGTGVLLEQDGALQFLHQSFAEYLAAGPAARNLDPRAWRQQMLDPARRNYALFTLARWANDQPDRDATAIVTPLLDRGDDEDLLAAAAVLAHGITLTDATEATIIDGLFTAANGSFGSQDFLAALSALPGRPAVTNGLANLIANPAVRPHIRVAAAGTYAALVNPAAARPALINIASDPQYDASARVQATTALGDLGEQTLAIGMLTSMSQDPAVSASVRVQAAEYLAKLGKQSVARKVLTSIAYDLSIRAFYRTGAARALGALGDHDTATSVLTSIIDNQHTDTFSQIWAAKELVQLGQVDAGTTVLLTIVHDPNITAFRRGTAAKILAELNQREAAINVLTSISDDPSTAIHERIEVARQLAELGEHADGAGNTPANRMRPIPVAEHGRRGTRARRCGGPRHGYRRTHPPDAQRTHRDPDTGRRPSARRVRETLPGHSGTQSDHAQSTRYRIQPRSRGTGAGRRGRISPCGSRAQAHCQRLARQSRIPRRSRLVPCRPR